MKTTTRRAQELSASLTHHMNNCYEARRLRDGVMIGSSGALTGCRMLAEFQQGTAFAGEYEIVRLVNGKVVETIDCTAENKLSAAGREFDAALAAAKGDKSVTATMRYTLKQRVKHAAAELATRTAALNYAILEVR